jgi:hypothetical protein
VVQLGTEARPAFASVAVYLYPAGAKTNYTGVFFSSFVEDTGRETPVQYEITAGSRPTLISHFGRVVEAPGSYEFRLSLRANIPDRTEPAMFVHAIPVRVIARTPATD